MNITLKYFGKIAEATNCNSEHIELQEKFTTTDLNNLLIKKYPSLVNIDFKLAINEVLMTDVIVLSDKDVVALLPPFAGG